MSRECRPTINQSLDQGDSFDNTALDRMFSQLFQGSDPRVTARKWPSIRTLVHVFTHRDQFPTLGRITFFLSSKICFDSRIEIFGNSTLRVSYSIKSKSIFYEKLNIFIRAHRIFDRDLFLI